MADTPQPGNTAAVDTARGAWTRLHQAMRRGDVILALGVVMIMLMLILPLPTWLLDFGLAISVTVSVLILMVSLFIEKPLQFSSFPTVLLLTTLIRLSLNLASTRLILGHGHEGLEGAGQVIAAFSTFIMSGSFVIGIIVFAILVIVNFVVITKGSGRIAEVAARFTLDGLPGKQMAIDADLSAGLIDEQTAKKRRLELEQESQFFGSMDGASKFVRGDAIAGLLITGINVIAGMIIGMAQNGLTFSQAADIYTKLTVGDGLVTQVPALLVSVAAGILVTKAGVTDTVDKALSAQLGGYPRAMGTAAALIFMMAVVPGMPFLPFAVLGGGMGAAAYFIDKSQRIRSEREAVEAEERTRQTTPVAEEPISTALRIDTVRLELGYGLLQMINNPKGVKLTDQIKSLRRAMASEIGFVMPSVRIQDNMQLPANAYVIYIKEVESGRGDLRPNHLLIMDPRGDDITLPGEKTKEPTFGLPAMWVEPTNREEALFRGYTVVDPPTVVTTHLTEVIKDNMAEMLSHSETQKLLDELDKDHQKLVAELIPTQITIGGLQRVLQNLLGERISVRDLPTILEGVAEACGHTRNVTMITEHVRARLARQISDNNTGHQGFIPLITLSPEWEQAFAEALVGQGEEKQLSMPPSQLQDFITRTRQTFERFAMQGETPVLLTSPMVRPYVRSIIERFRPVTVVMSQAEIHPKAKIKTMGQI
jgi:flagellar biosynthesis protein FlhA